MTKIKYAPWWQSLDMRRSVNVDLFCLFRDVGYAMQNQVLQRLIEEGRVERRQ